MLLLLIFLFYFLTVFEILQQVLQVGRPKLAYLPHEGIKHWRNSFVHNVWFSIFFTMPLQLNRINFIRFISTIKVGALTKQALFFNRLPRIVITLYSHFIPCNFLQDLSRVLEQKFFVIFAFGIASLGL